MQTTRWNMRTSLLDPSLVKNKSQPSLVKLLCYLSSLFMICSLRAGGPPRLHLLVVDRDRVQLVPALQHT